MNTVVAPIGIPTPFCAGRIDMKTMHSLTDAVAWYEQQKADDMFGFMLTVLLEYLPFGLAHPYLKPEASMLDWNAKVTPFTEEQVTADALKYMDFAWGKVLDHRGLSAGRSVQKLRMYCYLLGEDDLTVLCVDESKYPMYGAPILHAICTTLGWPIPPDDAIIRMAQGKACHDDCHEGCGRG